MQIVGNAAKSMIRHPLAINIRNLLNIRPSFYKSIPHGSSCSDLFLWISDENWSTHIDMMNLTNLCFPEVMQPEIARIILFDKDGRFLSETHYEIEPGKIVRSNISHLAQKVTSDAFGSFAILRNLGEENPFKAAETCLSERGYASFINTLGGLKQFIHGNSYVLYSNPGQKNGYRFVRSNFIFDKIYRVQTPLDDCDSSECIFLNPTDRIQRVKYVGYTRENIAVFSTERTIPPLAPDIVETPREVSRLEAISKVFMLRPVVRKNYKDRSDFFHA